MKNKVALALSGGGARGIAHIGVIEVLEENGYEIVSIAGTSMGALIGGVYCMGKLQEYKEWLYSLDKYKTFTLIDFSFKRNGLIKGDRILKTLKEFIPDKNIEDLPIPFKAIATDIKNGKEIVFESGSIYNAIRASIAIPTVFTPVKHKEKVLVDGGIVNNLPINHLEKKNEELIIAVDVIANIPMPEGNKPEEDAVQAKQKTVYQKKLNEFYEHLQSINPLRQSEEQFGFFDLINNTLLFMIERSTDLLLEKYEPDLLIEISKDACAAFDFYKAPELVELGRQAAQKMLSNFQG